MKLHIQITGKGTAGEIIASLQSIIAGIQDGLMEPETSPIEWEDQTLVTEIYAC
jgi:hypothetical protein